METRTRNIESKAWKALWIEIMQLGERMARRVLGDQYEYARDCGVDFICSVCKDPKLKQLPLTDATREWLAREATCHAHCFATRIKRGKKREVVDTDLMGTATEAVVQERRSPQRGPEQLASLSQATERLLRAMRRLPKNQGVVLFGVLIEEKTIQQLAQETGRDPHVLSQALYQGKERVRALMAKVGYTEEVIADLLSERA